MESNKWKTRAARVYGNKDGQRCGLKIGWENGHRSKCKYRRDWNMKTDKNKDAK